MTLRALALAVLMPLALLAGTVLAPSAGEGCRTVPFLRQPLCVSLDVSGVVARGIAQRSRSAALHEDNAILYALTSSPMLGVDFRPLQRLSVWWMD